jgi:hypothetical protein
LGTSGANTLLSSLEKSTVGNTKVRQLLASSVAFTCHTKIIVKATGTDTTTTKSRVLQYKTNATGLENKTFRKLVFGAIVGQHRTPPSATGIDPATADARKRSREQEAAEETLGSESKLSSDDETFQPNKLGGAAVDFE